jgi:hypothetical protein
MSSLFLDAWLRQADKAPNQALPRMAVPPRSLEIRGFCLNSGGENSFQARREEAVFLNPLNRRDVTGQPGFKSS